MALLRPFGRLVLAFSKFPISCQAEYIRGIERVARVQGYVTISQKPGKTSEKLDLSCNDIIANDTPSVTNDLQRSLVSLCFGAKHGRIRNEDLVRILENYMFRRDTFGASSDLAVLNYCGSTLSHVKAADRRNLASQVWTIIARDPSKLTLEHYNTLLNIHCQNNQPIDSKKFLNDMTVRPDIKTYTLLLNAAGKCGDVESSLYILSRMKNEDHPLNESIFNLIILAHANNRDINAALLMLESMKNCGIQPSTDTYANIACGYATSGDIEKTLKILNTHSLNTSQILEIVKHLSNSNLSRHIPDVLAFVQTPLNHNDTIFLVNTLTDLTHNGHPEDAFEVINYLTPAETNDETNNVFEGFLKDMIRAETPSITVLKFMDQIMKLKNYSLAIMDVCEGALRSGDRVLAMAVLEAMHERKIQVRPHYYWPILIRASQDDGETDVFRILKHMFCLNVIADHETLVNHVMPYINTIDPLTTMRKLGDLGLEHSIVLTPLVCYLLSQGNIRAAFDLCSRTKATVNFDEVLPFIGWAYKRTKNISDCVKMFEFAPLDQFYPEQFLHIIFEKFSSGQNALLLNEFLRAFHDSNIPVSGFTTIESGKVTLINPLNSIKTATTIPHPRDMNVEELECHLIELKAKGMNVRGIMRKLLQIHCRENNFERVEEITDEYDKSNFLWTPGMHSSLMQFYVNNGKMAEAMTLYAQLKDNKDFKIDDFKLISLATALVKNNMISEAFKILDSSKTDGKSRLSKDCWRLLDAIAHSSSADLTESMLQVLVNAGYCSRTNTILGPLVRVHLLKENLQDAVETFVKCAESYRCTPLRQELVCALVKSIQTDKSTKTEMIELLEQVQSITERLYNSANAKTDLIVAFARLEMKTKLRKFLQNNSVPDECLSRSLILVPEDAKLPILKTLFEASEGIADVNRCLICEELLSVYSRSGNCEQAIELWEKMLADDLLIPLKFRTILESLLTKHKVPLPEVLRDKTFSQ